MLTEVFSHRSRLAALGVLLPILLLSLLCTPAALAGNASTGASTCGGSSRTSCTGAAAAPPPAPSPAARPVANQPPLLHAATAPAAVLQAAEALDAMHQHRFLEYQLPAIAIEEADLQIPSRQLLQSSAVTSACAGAGSSSAGAMSDSAAVFQTAQTLLGDSRLQLTDARFTGSCRALGSAAFSPPHAFAALFPAAVVLSTGDAQHAAGDIQDSHKLSTDLQQPGDASIGAYTRDAAMLELDLNVSPAIGVTEQLVLNYMFGSQEYGSKNPNPDILSITISRQSGDLGSSSEEYTDVAVLPGGSHVPTPSVGDGSKAAVQVFSNSGGKYRTALNGFTQVRLSSCYILNM